MHNFITTKILLPCIKNSVIIGTIVVVIILGVAGFFLIGLIPKENLSGEEGLIKEENITQLTFLDNLAGDPSWSPNGSKLVFLGLEKNLMKGGLYIMNDDGTGIAKVAGQWGRENLFNPSWNPANNKIICHGPGFGQGPGGKGLYLIDLDGDTTKRTELSSQIVEHVSWNHDGKKIAYNVYNEDRSFSSIWVMNADGSEQTQLTTTGNGFCTGPSFSYDGSKIVYLKGFTTTLPGPKPENAINEIWVMNSDGSNKHMIYAPGEGMQLIRERAWNKDDEIIFARHLPNKAPQIWVINSDGTNPKLIFDPEEEGIPTAIYDDPVWDNNGTKVAMTKVIVSDESWQIATFSWESSESTGETGIEEEGTGETSESVEPSDLTQLTFFEEQGGRAVDPDWSLDGSQIVFCLMTGSLDDAEIYLINADGTGLTKIGSGYDPSWSPVEDKIAYSSNSQIYIMNSDGEEITQLTTGYGGGAPAWSLDGTRIVYSYYEDGKASIWIMNSDGTGKTPLTTSSDGESSLPSFSYDGSKIVYVKGPTWNTIIEVLPTKLNEIWIMNSDGSNKHMIYAPEDSYQWPFQRAWNRNNKILFMKNGILEDKLPRMFVINSDGTNPEQMVSPTMDSFGRPNYFYLDPVWDNNYTKVVAIRKIIDGAQNVVTFSGESSENESSESTGETGTTNASTGEPVIINESIGEADVEWTSEGLRVSGEFVDTEVFQLPDGSYAIHLGGLGKVAYSPDGLTWTISGDDVIGEAPSILKLPNDGYRAWWSVPKGAETFDMLTAFSSDGYNWETATMLSSSNMEDFYGVIPAVVISSEGAYRMYYTRTGPDTFIKPDLPGVELFIKRIYSAHSLDGLFWEPDPGIRIDGGDEADGGHASSCDVYLRDDGKYEMVYNSLNYGIGVAVSDEGLDWTRLGSTGMDGADPVVNVFSDGTVRMYYAVYVPESKKDDVITSDIVAGVYSAVRELT